jgi:hypothetical protein
MSVNVQRQATMQHAVNSSTLADVLERILDKGVVIAGDIKIKLVDIELLTIQIRLVVASVDKAMEMGMDWWMGNPDFRSKALQPAAADPELATLRARIEQLERLSPTAIPTTVAATCETIG